MWWNRRNKSLVAVDHGACSLRAVQLRYEKGAPYVVHWINIEHRAASSDSQANSEDAGSPSEFLSGLQQFGYPNAGLIASPADVDYCLLAVPETLWSQEESRLVESIRWEVGRQLNWPVDGAELSAWALPGVMGGGANAMAVAARRDRIAASVEAVEQGRVVCERVEPAALSLVRACRSPAAAVNQEIWGVLDLGYSAHRIYLATESVVIYARQVRGSGHAWTQLIAQELHVDYAEAEQYKRKCGIGEETRGLRTPAGSMEPLTDAALPGVILSVMKNTLTETMYDIERAFRFVMEQYPKRPLGSLVLVGGGSRMPGLAEWMSRELGIPVEQAKVDGILNLDASHPMSKPSVYAAMASCVGMALGEAMA